MPLSRRRALLTPLLFAFPARAHAAGPTREPVLPARTYRLAAPEGVVRVYRPRRFRAETAGVVIYVHGLYTDVDRAWTEHQLPQQFAASGRNAVFVVPAARTEATDVPPWSDLQVLLDTAARATGQPLPEGPLVIAGHSGAYKQIMMWLPDARVQTLLLLDAIYGGEPEFRDWLQTRPENRLAMINHDRDTISAAATMVAGLPALVYRKRAPAAFSALTANERAAKILSMDTPVDHFGVVTHGFFLPLLLRWSGLVARH